MVTAFVFPATEAGADLHSLRRRLLVSATLLLVLFFGVLGFVLIKEFKETVFDNVQDALRNQILLLMADIELVDGQVEMPVRVAEPRLSQSDSSLYAEVRQQQVAWRSDSLLEQSLPTLTHIQGEFLFTDASSDESGLLHMTFGATWETEQGDMPFSVHVAEVAQPHIKRVQRYERAMWLWLAALGGALILLLWTVLAWALNPLAKVTTQVSEIEQGQRRRFDEDFPLEVSQLTQNLNQLLGFEEKRIERHKEVLGNLAHSLKTPIAVLSGLRYARETKDQVDPQLETMRNIIEYQLQSASAVGRRRFAKPIEVIAPTKQIISSLSKLHQSKNLRHEIVSPSDLQFFGDQGDWMELVGNLLDNAFKWASGEVSIDISPIPLENGQSNRHGVRIVVEDDGPGIDDQLKQRIIERGVRLDSQTPGHGLGLHIVKGIVEAYEGELAIEARTPSGTRFIVTLN